METYEALPHAVVDRPCPVIVDDKSLFSAVVSGYSVMKGLV